MDRRTTKSLLLLKSSQKGFYMNVNYQDLNMIHTGYGCSETYG
ncbi:hypothetical protein EDO6_03895 [Paenibacillus xylanexedens]|nr:hypothetical protein EDO6_03895 [Paenibacillus xylanexedens]